MRILSIAFAASLTVTGAGAGQNADPALEGPVVYSVDSPFQGRRVVIVQDPGGLSAAHRPYEDEASPLDPGSEAEGGPDALNWRFEGPRTGGDLAQFDLEMLSIEETDPLQRGVAYVDYPRVELFDPEEHDPEAAWSASGIKAELERGEDDRTVAGFEADHHILTVSYDFTTYGEDGEPAGVEEREHVQDLWLAPGLPYSPLQLYPGLSYGFALSGSGKPMIDLAVLEQIESQLSRLGAVVRTAQPEPRNFGGIEGRVVMEISAPQPAPALELPEVESAPVVPERLMDLVVGPLFLAEMLGDGDAISPDGDASMSFDAGFSAALEGGRSAYRMTPAQDFALALAANDGEDGARGLMVLMRPVNGAPEPGAYEVANPIPQSEVATLSEDALAGRTAKFQTFGLIERDGVRYVLTGFDAGQVMIESGSEGRVSGSVDAAVSAVRVDTGAVVGPIEITASFDAVEGLDDFYFRSPESRYVD